MNRDLFVVDADGHYVERVDEWAAHLTPSERDRFGPTLHVDADGVERVSIGDWYVLPPVGVNPMGGMSMGDGMTPRTADGAPPKALGRRIDEAAPGGLDPQARLEVMEEEGIAASVLYPTLALSCFRAIDDPAAASALGRALNDWVAERWAAAAPDRLFPVATLPLHDPRWAADELERCVRDHGLKAGWISPAPVMGRVVDDPAHDVVWERAADLGVPLTTHHGSGGGGLPALGRDRNGTWLGSHAMGHPFEAMAAIAGLYTSRVFQRFPGLRWGFFEAGTGWLPFWLEQLHEHAVRMSWLVPDMAADEDIRTIFADRCVVTAEGEDEFVGSALDHTSEHSVVWASDYPHFDCVHPGLTRDLRERDDLPAERLAAVAATNAIRFFDLDVTPPA